MARTRENQDIVSNAHFWAEFKNTRWYDALKGYCLDRIRAGKDASLDMLKEGEAEEARATASEVEGIKQVLMFIDGEVDRLNDVLAEEADDREYGREIPNHI